MKMHSGVHDGGRWMEEVGVLLVMSFSWGSALGMWGRLLAWRRWRVGVGVGVRDVWCGEVKVRKFDSASWLPIRVVLVVMSVRWGVVSF